MAAREGYRVRILRRASPQAAPRWEEFLIRRRPHINVIVALRDIAARPVTAEGRATTPVAYDANCLEEVCGACAMLVNGRPRQACSALLADLKEPIRLEPLSKFPVVRDLVVDRGRMFRDLIRVRAWIEIDGLYALGPGPRQSQEDQRRAYPLSRCIACGNCLEVCPQYNERTEFVGAALLNQARRFDLHPTGQMQSAPRLNSLLGPGGIQDCGYAQNCVRVCPKNIPLTESIAEVNREVLGHVWNRGMGR